MSEKHTPGPWIRGTENWSSHVIAPSKFEPHPLAIFSGRGREEDDANAALAAAAPDLLEALKHIREIATDHACYLGDDAPQDEVLAVGGDAAIITEIGQIAGRVIAKAMGQG